MWRPWPAGSFRLVGAVAAALVVAGASASSTQAHDGPPRRQTASERQAARELGERLRAQGPSATKQSARAALTRDAERRRDLLNELADTDPGAVLDLALAPSERAALPGFLQAQVEQRTTRDGELRVLHIDYEDGHSEYDVKLVDGGRETPLRFGRPLRGAQPGDRVRVVGLALAGKDVLISDEVTVVAASPSAAGPTGPQRTAIILASAPGAATHPYSNKTNTASLFFSSSNPQSARVFYTEATYGQTTIVGGSGGEGTVADVYGPYTLTSATCDPTTIRNEAFAAADPNLNYNSYDRIVISWNHAACGNGGIGTVRAPSQGSRDGATQYLSISWNFNAALGSAALDGKIGGVALHEYGHNLGVWHANTLECGKTASGDDSCSSTEYGDPADLMGSTSGYGHHNGVHKDILTWLNGRSQTVNASGTYTINAYEHSSANVKVLRIPRTRDSSGNVNGYYYLEYRKPTATWNAFLSGRPDFGNGVLVHTSGATPLCTDRCNPDFSGSGGGGDSHLIDTQPNTLTGLGDFNDAPLLLGESYLDPAAGVSLLVTATTSSSATVSVTLSTPQRSIQTVVYPAGAGSASGGGTYAAGQSATLTASPNSGYCFTRWREQRADQSYPNPYTFTVNADRMLEAVFSVGACAGPPPNDEFSQATSFSVSQRFSTTTGGATVESGEPLTAGGACGPSSLTIGRTVWYVHTPAATGTLTVNTADSDFDTVLAAYAGSLLTGLTPETCNDDLDASGGNLQSRISLSVAAGTTYYLQVGGFNGASGTLVTDVQFEAATVTQTPTVTSTPTATQPPPTLETTSTPTPTATMSPTPTTTPTPVPPTKTPTPTATTAPTSTPTATATAVPDARLSVGLSASPDPVASESSLTYRLVVSNAGPDPAENVVLTDLLPSRVAFESATTSRGSCGHEAGTVSCELGSLASGTSASVTIVVTVMPMEGSASSTTLRNAVSLSHDGRLLSLDSDSVSIETLAKGLRRPVAARVSGEAQAFAAASVTTTTPKPLATATLTPTATRPSSSSTPRRVAPARAGAQVNELDLLAPVRGLARWLGLPATV